MENSQLRQGGEGSMFPWRKDLKNVWRMHETARLGKALAGETWVQGCSPSTEQPQIQGFPSFTISTAGPDLVCISYNYEFPTQIPRVVITAARYGDIECSEVRSCGCHWEVTRISARAYWAKCVGQVSMTLGKKSETYIYFIPTSGPKHKLCSQEPFTLTEVDSIHFSSSHLTVLSFLLHEGVSRKHIITYLRFITPFWENKILSKCEALFWSKSFPNRLSCIEF